jgi:hypothetical protein
MQPLLIVFLLNVESSYVQNVERLSESHSDTIQFLLIDGEAWRIKTYAIDHDVHVWNIGILEVDEFERLAESNTMKHYSDVLQRKVVAQGKGSLESLASELQRQGLPPNLEISPGAEFAFWVPEPNVYSTRSTPP